MEKAHFIKDLGNENSVEVVDNQVSIQDAMANAVKPMTLDEVIQLFQIWQGQIPTLTLSKMYF